MFNRRTAYHSCRLMESERIIICKVSCLLNGIIRLFDSAYASVMLAEKTIVLHIIHKVNPITIKDEYPLQLIDD